MGIEIKAAVHRRLLALRCIQRTLDLDSFEEAFNQATPEEKTQLEELVAKFKDKEVKAWISKINKGRLEFMSHRQLAKLGKENNVYLWSRLTRDELIEELKKCNWHGTTSTTSSS
jgi:hypothetical protein